MIGWLIRVLTMPVCPYCKHKTVYRLNVRHCPVCYRVARKIKGKWEFR